METLIATQAAAPTQSTLTTISQATYVQAMQSSFTSAKFSLQLELATSLAMFASTGRVDTETKRMLREIYVAAGYDAATPSGFEYKTIAKKCQTASLLYTHIGRDVIASWISGMAEMMVINTIINNIAPLNLHSWDGVLAHVGKVRQPPKAKVAPIEVVATAQQVPLTEGFVERRGKPPVEEVLTPHGELAEGQHGALQEHLFRRATDAEATPETMTDLEAERYENWLASRGENPILNARQIAAGYKHVHTEHLAITVPPTCSKAEIIAAAMELLKLAGEMDGEASDVVKEVQEEALEEDLEAMKAHQLQEAQRLEAEAIAAKKTPIAPQAASRYRKGVPVVKK